ncbi:MAG: T9SS type A sorting domain-containing protein [Sphingobacteriales bacterium]|nr:T9SS type A sorting domain-containing protein [Sphingobacteriales bacterium]
MNIKKSFSIFSLIILILSLIFFEGCLKKINPVVDNAEMYDGPDQAMQFEFDRTKDPATGKVPRERLIHALQYTDSLKAILPMQFIAGYGNWAERGPVSDVVGPSNGNTRANSGIASGRIRASLVDAADATGNTVWVGGVAGGLWKTTDITASPATWTPINDFFSNMAITSICQNPTLSSTMYFCTGEAYYNTDAVKGDGIFKTTNSGISWTQLASTIPSQFDYCTKILCDASGNVYVSTRSGIFRSVDGGTTWVDITPTGLAGYGVSDMELSSTGRLHISAGVFVGATDYRFTNSPSTVAAGTWTSASSGYPTSTIRIELGCNGNILYSLPSNASYQVPTIYKSTDGGANWAATTGQPTAGWASGQAWYALAVDVDGSGNVIVGGLDPYRSTNGGTNWTKLADWTNNAGLPPATTQYVHADIHNIKMYGSNRVLFCCDGGIHYSSDNGTTIRDRNSGLRIKQFFSCAIHPSTTDYFLAGAQDNGSHKFTSTGLGSTVEVTGGDGAFVHIDQKNPLYQYTSYVYNNLYRSSNGGANWTGTLASNTGLFINPTDYDTASLIMYCGNTTGSYLRWTNPRTGSTSAAVTITGFNATDVTAITVSPYTTNRVYFGTSGGRVVQVDNANTIVSGSAGSNISTGLPAANVSCIAVGSTDNNLMACYSNYGVQQIWISSNGGSSWTNIDGDLPDMPVRWCMFSPFSNTVAIIATEAGVYLTLNINGASTAWIPSPSFPTVRTDMIKYRPSDHLVAAATHGRGLWTQSYYSIVPTNKFLLQGKWNNETVQLQWNYGDAFPVNSFDVEESSDAIHFTKKGTVNYNSKNAYSFVDVPAQQHVYYRISSHEVSGNIRYSNTLKLFKNSANGEPEISRIFPNPVQHDLNLIFKIAARGMANFSIANLAGQTIWNRSENFIMTGVYTRNWDIGNLPKGPYILTLYSNGRKTTQKFIK